MKRRKKIPKKRKILDKKLIFSTGIIAVIVLGLLYYKVSFKTPEIKFSMRAAIIDQLGRDFPNSEFNDTENGRVAKLLRNYGFDVSYHPSENIDIAFYRGLAKYDYGLIILRAHSALREDNQTGAPVAVDLFTSENYTDDESYLWKERKLGLVTKGFYRWRPNQWYFAITSKFIESLEGYFPKSIVIAMGCWSLKPGFEEMAEAFIQKGATAYIGWTDAVYPQDTDKETINLLNMLLNDDKKLSDAISETNGYPIPGGTTHLDFHRKSAGNLKISELINEAKSSTTIQKSVDSLKPLPLLLFCVTNVINYKSKYFASKIKEKNKRFTQYII